MDLILIRQARETGCRGCLFYSDRPGQELADTFGECRVGQPRTSSPVRWPRVRPGEFCGMFQPVDARVPVQAEDSRTGRLAIGGRL